MALQLLFRRENLRASLPKLLTKLFAIDLRALAVLRIGLGVLLLLQLAQRAWYMHDVQAGDGFYPLELARTKYKLLSSLHLFNGSITYQIVLHIASAAAALLLIVGYRTRLATAVSWYLYISLIHRNAYITDVGDSVLSLLLFWCIFLPLGQRFALDSWESTTHRSAGSICSAASAGLLLQPAWIYFFSSLLKLKSPSWRNGNAVFEALSDDIWCRDLGNRVLESVPLAKALTFLTLGVEFLAPLLLFMPVATTPCRYVAIFLLVGFQIGIGSSIQLNWIPVTMTLALVPFLPQRVWDGLTRLLWRNAADPAGTSCSRSPIWLDSLTSVVLLYVFLANVDSVLGRWFWLPGITHRAARQMELAQDWSMYVSPSGGRFRVIHRFDLETGERIERVIGPNRTGWPPAERWDRLNLFWDDYRTKYFIYDKGHFDSSHRLQDAYLAWVCRQWDAENPTRRVKEVAILREIRKNVPGEPLYQLERVEEVRTYFPGE